MMLLTGVLASSTAVSAYAGPRKQNGSVPLFDPAQFGAAGDGKALDSPAINAAIDACTKAGGGMVYLRPGIYRSGTVVLKSNVTLYLEAGAVLLGSTEMSDYGAKGRVMHVSGHSTKHLIYAEDAENITLGGPGRIDGQGSTFWEPSPPHNVKPGSEWKEVASLASQAKPTGRPTPMIQFNSCRSVHIEDLHIGGASGWTMYLVNCDSVYVQGVAIKNSVTGRNTDGIDLDGCQNVFIANSSIETGDDAIVFKSEDPLGHGPRLARNIAITNCVLSTCCNAFKIGSGSQGGFENITFSNSVIYSNPGDYKNRVVSGIALEVVDGGWIDGMVITGIQMQRARNPIFIRLGNRSNPHQTEKHGLRGITIENIHATESIIPSSITGIPGALVSDVTLSNIHIENALPSRPEWVHREVPELPAAYPESIMFGMLPVSGLYARHVQDLSLRDISFRTAEGEARSTVALDNVSGVRMHGIKSSPIAGSQPVIQVSNAKDAWISGAAAPANTAGYIAVSGAESSGVLISGCDLRNARKGIVVGSEVPQQAVTESGNISAAS
jgi:hypothetical protein